MPKTPMKDMVVLLPGIMGSVLQDRDGRDVWNLSLQAVLRGTHGALQTNDHIWSLLKDNLKRLQNITSDFQNPLSSESKKQPAAISLNVDDLYLPDEEVRLSAEIMNVDSKTLARFGGLRARIAPVSSNGEKPKIEKYSLEQQGDNSYGLTLEPNKLAPGLYRLEVETSTAHGQAPNSVHTLFAIAE